MADPDTTSTEADAGGKFLGFGSNQWIALLALNLPIAIATTMVFMETGGASAEWWGGFVSGLVPSIVLVALGGSAVIKGLPALGDVLGRLGDLARARKAGS